MFKSLRIAIPLLALMLLLAGAAITFAAGGTGPGDALIANGAPQTVASNSALWFRFDYGGNKKEATVALDAADASGLRLAIYTPQAVEAWQNGESLKSVGAGSSIPGHALGWIGEFNFPGTIYAAAYNDTAAPVTVQVNASGENVTTDPKVAVPTATPLPNPFHEDTPIGKGIAGKLAFLDSQGGKLYTVQGDGTDLKQISFGLDPQWNHAGTQIALARQGPTAGVFTINPDGSNERLLYSTTDPRAPDWSPDDSQLVFSRQDGIKGGGEFCFRGRCFNVPASSLWKLGLLATADGKYSDLPTTNHAFTPTWNADGSTIAFNDTAIGVIKTSPTGDQSLEPFIGDLRQGSATYDPLKVLSPQYSPDGKQMVLMVAQPPTWQIAIANADGSNRHLLTSLDPLDFTHANNVAPVWSPDGKQILFLSDRNGKWEFFVMNADGTNVLQVLKGVSDQIPLNYTYQGERLVSWSK